MTARAADTEEILVMNVSTMATEKSELRTMVSGETDKRGIPVYRSATGKYISWRTPTRRNE